MTATIYDVTDQYAKVAPDATRMKKARGNVYTSADGRTIYSYGSHFPMARIMPSGDEPRGWWLVNGDRYSVTTSRHQSELRSALTRTGLPMLIVPFSAMDRAGIKQASIVPVEIQPEEYTTVTRRGAAEDMPAYVWDFRELTSDARPDDKLRLVEWDVREHHLGASVFTAEYEVSRYDGKAWHYDKRRAAFVSAFDAQEGHGLYFLAELPEGRVPVSVANALVMLRPDEVQDADAAGVAVTRQGDVFAVPAPEVTTSSLPGPSEHGAYVLGVNHTATEVRERDGVTYARGTLRHRPREMWRRPEHRMQKMGDGKTWHKIVKNTVPAGRSWSVDGRVD